MPTPREGPRTITEIAALAGVSKSTVSRVLNGQPGVSSAARAKVEQVLPQNGFRPNRAARSLRSRRTGSIGLVVSEDHERMFSDPFFASIVRGATEVTRGLGIHLVLHLAEDESARGQLLDYLRDGHVDGVLLVSSHADDPLPAALADERLPAVLSGRPARHLPISTVDVENVLGAEMAVEHLVAAGRTRIATVAGPLDMPAAQDRLEGWRRGLAAARLPHGAELVAHGTFERGSGNVPTEELLAGGSFDAVFAASDLMALDVLQVLQRNGIRVPEDVSVVGFDGIAEGAHSRPALTTVAQPIEAMGAAMARLLLDLIADPTMPVTRRVFDPTLVVRGSG